MAEPGGPPTPTIEEAHAGLSRWFAPGEMPLAVVVGDHGEGAVHLVLTTRHLWFAGLTWNPINSIPLTIVKRVLRDISGVMFHLAAGPLSVRVWDDGAADAFVVGASDWQQLAAERDA